MTQAQAPAGDVPPVPTLVYLHALGSSRRAIDGVAAQLGDRFDILAIDLPGFGDAHGLGAATVEEMADHVVRKIATQEPTRWLLVGHSMGGKIASIVAARTLDGTAGLFGLAGVVLLAGSPLSPEPMDDDRREQMIGWADGESIGPGDARTFVDANVGSPLPPDIDALVLGDIARTSMEAWTAWLERGSREDWTPAVGEIAAPALIVSGGSDGDLGPEAQRDLNGSVYPRSTFATLDGAGHLLPWERPAEVAALITSFAETIALAGPAVPADTAVLIASPRTSARTRGILARRALADDPAYEPEALTTAQLQTLRAVAERIVPQQHPAIDLAARLDAQLARGDGDGWRNAESPPDAEAYSLALDALADFAGLAPDDRDERLRAIAASGFSLEGSGLTGAQFAAWFEDVSADLVRLWLAHPASAARIGFDGFANGGDGLRKTGFRVLAAGRREAWEPALQIARIGNGQA
ncbi:alpha/beta fold hydrolase [Herbiconiux sp. YIM B11900]|uniref:alpha/beta hydrolase n=1 Tax=Herbiconiux sp. YIM B11900 TaxID=3404131 RepID=UPI003F84DB0C